jgi:CRISPR-associated protein Csm5
LVSRQLQNKEHESQREKAMNAFLSTHTLSLTPLSPIHIGCGEDFEPTNYVIEDGLLYGFDPSRATLTELQRSKLGDVARRGSLAGIQRFFRDNAAAFKPHAHVVMPVCAGVARLYEQRIGKAANVEASGNQVFNKLEIERHVFTGLLQQPFIPGTSFKGALRTAWLDELNGGRKPMYEDNVNRFGSAQMEKRLLWGEDQRGQLGDFQTSPLRLLKVADLMPTREPEREVLFAVNRKKRRVIKDGKLIEGRGPVARKDCVLPGQYRLFQAGVTLPALLNKIGTINHKREHLTPHAEKVNLEGALDLSGLARQSNVYHRELLEYELGELSRNRSGLVSEIWQKGLDNLLSPLSDLGIKLEKGDAFLIRLGRYGGAESKTLTGDGVASIKIMEGKGPDGRNRFSFQSKTKTVWLAAQQEDQQERLIPFGWAVVEIDPVGECESLKQWCSQAKARNYPDLQAVRERNRLEATQAIARFKEEERLAIEREAQLERERRAAEEEACRQAAIIAEQQRIKAEVLEAERIKQAEKEALRAAMTLQQRAIADFCAECEKQLGYANFKKKAWDDRNASLYKDAAALVKTALESPDWSAADKAALADMLEAWLPKVIAPWEPKEQRKKLKFAALRGQ